MTFSLIAPFGHNSSSLVSHFFFLMPSLSDIYYQDLSPLLFRGHLPFTCHIQRGAIEYMHVDIK